MNDNIPYTIDRLWGPDLTQEFLDLIAHLSPVTIQQKDIGETYRDMMVRGVSTYVAKVGTRMVATASYYKERKFIRTDKKVETRGGLVGHVEDVVVHPDFRGRGIGKALVARLVEEAREDGCYKIVLDCLDHNIKCYEECGFHIAQTQMRMDLGDTRSATPIPDHFDIQIDALPGRVSFTFPARIKSFSLGVDDTGRLIEFTQAKMQEAIELATEE